MTLREKTLALIGTWSRPPDFPARAALVLAALLALAAIFGRGPSVLVGGEVEAPPEARRSERRRLLAIVGLVAGLLSIAYMASYLRGGPRIIDATTYFLQGRALSHGDLAWTPPEGPSASFRGRFLIYRGIGDDGASLGGIFPPGYPLLLALGFAVGAPMIVGPLLAIGLVVATYHLARTIAEDARPELAEPIARGAALLSVVCAALRYHTADTMSHGASALGVTIALTCALRARKARDGRGEALLAGAAVGYVVATRPVSAIPIAIIVGWLLLPLNSRGEGRRGPFALLALGMLPGALLLLLSQRAVTGSWLASSQRMYYTLSDGPPGCFRWGFGKGTGCLFEHGDFVRARLEGGYGIVEAAGTTLRRLHAHLLDVANLEPLALLVLAPAVLRRRCASAASALAATALVGLQVLAYAPFYFDGDYPGGGARFFADILPVEHALVMVGVACLFRGSPGDHTRLFRGSLPPCSPRRELAFTRASLAVLALATAGFGIHAAYEHGKLRDRDGGLPMFEPDVLARAGVTSGLVYVDTDHGFALGHDPAARPDERVVVARLRNDDRDRMLFDAMGRPPTWLYKLEPGAAPAFEGRAALTPWAPPDAGKLLRFEAEAEWPPLGQDDGYAVPEWVDACASGRRALVLTPSSGRHARAQIEVPVPAEGDWSVEVHLVAPPSSKAGPRLEEGAVTVGSTRWAWQEQAEGCTALPERVLTLHPPREELTIEARGGAVAVDYVALRRAP